MPFKEVNELRKSGKLQEALTMARDDVSNMRDTWSYRALFWVLRDISNFFLDENDHDDAEKAINEMAAILPNLQETDGIAAKALKTQQNKLVPHHTLIKEASQKSKNGQTRQAFDMVYPLWEKNEVDKSMHTDWGWIIYRYLKDNLTSIDSLATRKALHAYLQLDVERPSLLHSCILRMAIELESAHKRDFKFTVFLKMWGFDNFMPEDWQQGRNDSTATTKYYSLVEKAIFKYSAELKDDQILDIPHEYEELLNNAIKTFPHNELLRVYLARIYTVTNRKEAALEAYRHLVMTTRQPYVWAELCDLLPNDQLRIAALCQAILLQHDPKLCSKYHLRLGIMLANNGDMGQGAIELALYNQTCESNNWRKDPSYHEAVGNTGVANPTFNKKFYFNKVSAIEEFIFSDTAPLHAVVISRYHNKNNKPRARLLCSNAQTVEVNANQLKDSKNIYFTLRLIKSNGKRLAVTVRPTSKDSFLANMQGFKQGIVRKKIDRNNHQYCFIDNCYVGSQFLSDVSNGEQLRILSVPDKTGRDKAVYAIKVS